MAKDPAFLFYPGDWLGGTILLTRHQKGCYIDLLMAQFNSGPLTLDQIKTVLGQDQAMWTVLREKFTTDNSGRFFNTKLAAEIEKRKAYTASLANRGQGRKKTSDFSKEKQLNNHMEDVNENEIVDEDKRGIGGLGGRGGIVIYSPAAFLEETENSKWLENIAAHFRSEIESCRDKLRVFTSEQNVKSAFPRNLADITNHFFNWYRMQIKNSDKNKSSVPNEDKSLSEQIKNKYANRR